MRATVFVFVVSLAVGAQAGCEWYKNCGECVADSGCGWCSNDPKGVGSGSVRSASTSGKTFMNTKNDGTEGDPTLAGSSNGENGVDVDWLVNIRGQYEKVVAVDTTNKKATLDKFLDFEGTGYLASPYFAQTAGGADRNKGLIGVHKSKFTHELKAGYTITPYMEDTYTVSSVQSDTQATLSSPWTNSFSNIEFQIGSIAASGTISYPDTSKQDVYGSWPPAPTKFTTELKDGYTIACTGAGAASGGTNVRIQHIYNDQHLTVDPRFQRTFANEKFEIELGPRGTGLISGTASTTRNEGSDPCRTSNDEACHENTRFVTELRINDQITITTPAPTPSPGPATEQTVTIASISSDAHVQLKTDLGSTLGTNSKFKIKSFHSSPFTYARKAAGGLKSIGQAGTGGKATTVESAAGKFTENLMAGYALIAKVPNVGWEKVSIVSIDSMTTLTIDKPFSAQIGYESSPPSIYNYESCPTLTYENFDLRTENGHGVLQNDGTNHVFDNVQYSLVRTSDVNTDPDKAAMFKRHLKPGFTITMDGITRTITHIYDNQLLTVDRAFKENVRFKDYSYRYSVRKTGDFHLHWKPSTVSGDYHKTDPAQPGDIYAHNMIADQTLAGDSIVKQDAYLQYPPVCYNTGRCVPKSSHSLVGVQGDKNVVTIQESTTGVYNYVQTNAETPTYFKNCKPVCTITVTVDATGINPLTSETRRVLKNHISDANVLVVERVFATIIPDFPSNASPLTRNGRVRYVTGTGTVKTDSGSLTVTGASKETKTKFNSEFASQWSIAIGCGGATCTDATCANHADCDLINGKTTGGKCTSNICTAEIKSINSIKSDTRLETNQPFINDYTKVDYTIGDIPALGLITSSQNSKIVDGNDNTRFLEQLKVGYTISLLSQTRTVNHITSNKLMSIHQAFNSPGITTATAYKFSGKKGTGEVSVTVGGGGAQDKVVLGTSDVTQTQFFNELDLGYLFMIGEDYKVITQIQSNTQLMVDTPFGSDAVKNSVYASSDYNYESCWLNMGAVEAGAPYDAYTNKKIYVEDACEIKPGCCGFKISSRVWPDRFAYYKIRPPHTNMNIRVIVKTTEDNVDLVVKKSGVPTTSSYDYKSVRESNPWALTVPQEKITCPAWAGRADEMPPNNCDYWYIGVRGDNRYPQKTGASEYDLYVYTEFDWPNFLCSDAKSDQTNDKCKWLGISKNDDANMVTNDDSQAVMRLTPAHHQTKGSMYYSTKVHLYDGFETTFQFRMTGFSVGCNSVMYPSGFCGGGDGFAFVIQKEDDMQIGCTGAGLGYALTQANKQGDDWSRHRCTSVDASPLSTCDDQDDGDFSELCAIGTLCQVAGPDNGGCGVTGTCGFQSCANAIEMVLAVEFDTWNNLKLHDPKQGVSRWWINASEFVGYNDNHVAIFSSNGEMQSDHAMNEHFAATPSIPNLADGKNHTVKIKYWPQLLDFGKEHDGTYNRTNYKQRGDAHTANINQCGDCLDTQSTKSPSPDNCYNCFIKNNKPGNFAVFIDDMKRPVLQTAISLRKSPLGDDATCYDVDRDRCVLDELGNGYIGFTAATGGERAKGRTTGDAMGEWVHNTYVTSKVSTDTILNTGSAGAKDNMQAAVDAAEKILGAAQNHEILNWKFCNQIGCVPI